MSNIVKVIKYENSIDYLIKRFPSLSFVKEVFIFPYDEIAWTCNNKTQYHLQVIFVGKTGYGKSTTVNKLVGKEIFQSNDVVACTRESQCADFTISDEYYLSLSDLPGIGESATLDQEYMELYSNFLAPTSVIVYVVRADQRDYSIDEKTFKQLFKTQEQRSKVVLALNCVDKIEPINRKLPFQPSKEQLRNIEEKVNTLSSLFGLPTSRIIPYSAVEEWNLNGLMDTIAEVLKQSKNISIPPWITDEWKQLRSQLRFNY